MIGADVREFHRQLGVIPSHSDLFGRKATLPEVIERLRKYPVGEWLSFLARMQNMLAADQMGEKERIQRVLCGTVSPIVHKKLREFEGRVGPNAAGLYYERQMSTLQQLAVLHAPRDGTATLSSDEGRHDLSMSLLMTMDLMAADRDHTSSLETLLPVSIHDQIRMATTPAPDYAARAFCLYQLDKNARDSNVAEYLGLFELATGVSAVDCILGGLDILIWEESRDFDDIANCWQAVPRSQQCDNPKEAEVLGAYEAVRQKPLDDLHSLILKFDGDRAIRDWNLIALSQAPICDLGAKGAFVLNHTALGRSLLDSIRHAIVTAALERRLPKPYNDQRAIGGLFGKVFEKYVASVFASAFPSRVYEIPVHPSQQRSDLLVWFPDKVVIAEVKSVHFAGLRHPAFLSIADRREELDKIGMPNAIDQLEATIRAMRRGDITAPGMPNYDWTITPIVPVIVTEDRMPWVPGCWDAFYRPLSERLQDLRGAGAVANLRLMTIGEVEYLPDLQLPYDFATMMLRWAADPTVSELTWGSYLSTQAIKLHRAFMPKRFLELMKFLAERLGLDRAKVAFLDTE